MHVESIEDGEESPRSLYSQASAVHSLYHSGGRLGDEHDAEIPPVPTIAIAYQIHLPVAPLAPLSSEEPIIESDLATKRLSKGSLHLQDSVAFQFPMVVAQQGRLHSTSPATVDNPVILYANVGPHSPQYSPIVGQELDAPPQSASHWRSMRTALLDSIQDSKSYSPLPTPQF
jgi:hypothetical protein